MGAVLHKEFRAKFAKTKRKARRDRAARMLLQTRLPLRDQLALSGLRKNTYSSTPFLSSSWQACTGHPEIYQ
jgi:hypothetical protein